MSIKDIAQLTGLSTATISHAINGTRAVSVESKRRIEEAALKTGYKPSLAAKMLRTKRSRIIGLIVPSTEANNHTNSFYLDVMGGVRETLQARGYDMIVSMYSEQDIQVNLARMTIIQKRIVDGILLVPFSSERRSVDNILAMGVPLVLLDRRLDGLALPSIQSDNVEAAMGAIDLLIKSGRKRIAYLGGNMALSTLGDRYLGYKKAIQKAGAVFDPELVNVGLADTIAEGERQAERLVSMAADAFFTDRSMLMIGALEYCQRNNIRIPSDLGLVCFDDYSWMNIANPPITAIRQNARQIGETGARILLDLIEPPGLVPGQPFGQVVIPTEIILRCSH